MYFISFKINPTFTLDKSLEWHVHLFLILPIWNCDKEIIAKQLLLINVKIGWLCYYQTFFLHNWKGNIKKCYWTVPFNSLISKVSVMVFSNWEVESPSQKSINSTMRLFNCYKRESTDFMAESFTFSFTECSCSLNRL